MPSTRTPEGTPNRCTLCGHAVWAEPSSVSRDAPCPHCGTLLWFADVPEGIEPEAVQPERRPKRRPVPRPKRSVLRAIRDFLSRHSRRRPAEAAEGGPSGRRRAA